MTVEELLTQVRYQINDTDKVEYTDTELIGYVNDGLDFISKELIRLSSPVLLKYTTLSLTDGAADLPNDFVREEGVLDSQGNLLKSYPPIKPVDQYGYKIIGSKLYSNNTSVDLFYYAFYPKVSALTDTIPIPDYMVQLLKEIVIFLALNRNEFSLNVEQELLKVFASQVYDIAKMTGETYYERELPFKV